MAVRRRVKAFSSPYTRACTDIYLVTRHVELALMIDTPWLDWRQSFCSHLPLIRTLLALLPSYSSRLHAGAWATESTTKNSDCLDLIQQCSYAAAEQVMRQPRLGLVDGDYHYDSYRPISLSYPSRHSPGPRYLLCPCLLLLRSLISLPYLSSAWAHSSESARVDCIASW
ncbi:hypothetical protein BDZ85DRAFT_86813 [Elsinoe ampelina]|uniref:Uncharacterized protein n=1 Tax=Elsinoe ampelina TaxID=302913 RepID=A0A6A6GH20_9PEZI|nr:hypothetical protein BDZ85DRAFT_86813 [Elsinoe ampelina]